MEYVDYRVGFYVANAKQDPDNDTVEVYFNDVVADQSAVTLPWGVATNIYFILDLSKKADGQFEGIFAKLRKSDLPTIGDITGTEKDIRLKENEGLLEKNFFRFDPNLKLVSWQHNLNASHIVWFERYLSRTLPFRITLDPVVTTDAAARLMSGNVQLATMDVSFAKPLNLDFYPKDRVSQHLLELMNTLNAESIRIHASANAPGRGADKILKNTVKRMLRGISETPNARVARTWSRETGELIDLIAERLETQITVPIQAGKRYPAPRTIFKALRDAGDNVADELEGYFGEDDERLD